MPHRSDHPTTAEKYEDDMFKYATGQISEEPTDVEKELVSHRNPFKIGDDIINEVVSDDIREHSTDAALSCIFFDLLDAFNLHHVIWARSNHS